MSFVGTEILAKFTGKICGQNSFGFAGVKAKETGDGIFRKLSAAVR